jgi:hypothetical protein
MKRIQDEDEKVRAGQMLFCLGILLTALFTGACQDVAREDYVPAKVCETGQLRCGYGGTVVEGCAAGKWVDYKICWEAGKVCAAQSGQPQCVSEVEPVEMCQAVGNDNLEACMWYGEKCGWCMDNGECYAVNTDGSPTNPCSNFIDILYNCKEIGGFYCFDYSCLPMEYACDGFMDCGGGEDEWYCSCAPPEETPDGECGLVSGVCEAQTDYNESNDWLAPCCDDPDCGCDAEGWCELIPCSIDGYCDPWCPEDSLDSDPDCSGVLCPDGNCGPCVPDCVGNECGDDGCGGSCGQCPAGVACGADGQCICTPNCNGKECGGDGCGGSCGNCGSKEFCAVGQCECAPDCSGKQCGSDGCGGDCGKCPCPGCAPNLTVCSGTTCVDDGVVSCSEIFDCLNLCEAEDSACTQSCFNSAPAEEQMKFDELYQCLVAVDYWSCWDICPNGSEDPNCDVNALNDCFAVKGKPCEAQMYACFPPGGWSCKDAWICLVSCPEGDEDCPPNCLNQMSAEGQQKWSVFIDCLDDNGYFNCFDLPESQQNACLEAPWDTCQPYLTACASGNKSCGWIWDCMSTCSLEDTVCPYECLYDGTAASQDAYFGVLDCIVGQCGDQPTEGCYNNALSGSCAGSYNYCMAQ